MARSRPSPRPEGGFTLIEVLVALAILAIALAAVMRTVSQSVDTTGALRERTLALMVAENRLALHRLQNDWPDLTKTSGTQGEGGRDWYWEEQVKQTPLPQFRRIEIDVRAKQGSDVLAHLVGFVRQPS